MKLKKLIKKLVPRRFFEKIVPVYHLVNAFIWQLVGGFPARKMKVIGVTGTNGKTTTSFLIHRMLLQTGYKVGLMTTVAYGAGEEIRPQIHHMTNVSPRELVKRLKWMRSAGVEWLVLETTSHALAQYRTWGVPYGLAVITNVTHEHLEYHKTFERYTSAKRKLFSLVGHNSAGLKTGIVNADDPVAASFASETGKSLSYGIEQGDIRAKAVKMTPRGISYKAEIGQDSYDIKSSLAGSFNVYNTLAAVSVGRVLGLSKEQIEHGISALESVEGRMVTVNEGQPYGVIVDFAHTPDSFEKLFKDLRRQISGKLIVMFGSAGRRDTKKRPVQGQIAGKYADLVVLTEEDDRDEDGVAILKQIAEGAKQAGKIENQDLFLELDRTKAIEMALGLAGGKNDMVLLLGKGHERTIERDDREDPWDEMETTRQTIKKLLKN